MFNAFVLQTAKGTDGVRTRDLRFTRPTPYHLATAPGSEKCRTDLVSNMRPSCRSYRGKPSVLRVDVMYPVTRGRGFKVTSCYPVTPGRGLKVTSCNPVTPGRGLKVTSCNPVTRGRIYSAALRSRRPPIDTGCNPEEEPPPRHPAAAVRLSQSSPM